MSPDVSLMKTTSGKNMALFYLIQFRYQTTHSKDCTYHQ